MIEITKKDIKRIEKTLGKENIKKTPMVVSRALNRSIASFKTEMYRNIKEDYTIKQKTVYNTITIKKASGKSLVSFIKSKGGMEALTAYKVSPVKPRPKNPPKVLKASVKKDGGLKPIPKAFMATYKGEDIAFQRKTKARDSIDRLRGPAVPLIIDNQKYIDKSYKKSVEIFNKRLEHEILRVLGVKQ